MKKKIKGGKLSLNKKVIGNLTDASKINGGLRQVADLNAADTNKLTGCGMTCWSYGDYCFLSENCA
ncbi:class I lanthipeptide [Taibaiella helva]|uniref:class I lanthipeptide n=1 Tax=Taibaiella helva TaxID=2301235 RepID=UPI000E57CB65|nr:class I lanthipeptide [Taibaiella helva]